MNRLPVGPDKWHAFFLLRAIAHTTDPALRLGALGLLCKTLKEPLQDELLVYVKAKPGELDKGLDFVMRRNRLLTELELRSLIYLRVLMEQRLAGMATSPQVAAQIAHEEAAKRRTAAEEQAYAMHGFLPDAQRTLHWQRYDAVKKTLPRTYAELLFREFQLASNTGEFREILARWESVASDPNLYFAPGPAILDMMLSGVEDMLPREQAEKVLALVKTAQATATADNDAALRAFVAVESLRDQKSSERWLGLFANAQRPADWLKIIADHGEPVTWTEYTPSAEPVAHEGIRLGKLDADRVIVWQHTPGQKPRVILVDAKLSNLSAHPKPAD